MATAAPVKPAFKPFVPANESRPELTVRALLLGAVFGVLFGAVTVYVGLRAGSDGRRQHSDLGAVDLDHALHFPGLRPARRQHP